MDLVSRPDLSFPLYLAHGQLSRTLRFVKPGRSFGEAPDLARKTNTRKMTTDESTSNDVPKTTGDEESSEDMNAARVEAHKVLAKVALSEEKRGSSADLPQKEKDEAQKEADETPAAASADTSKPSAEEQEKADEKAAADAKVGFSVVIRKRLLMYVLLNTSLYRLRKKRSSRTKRRSPRRS